MSKRNPSQIGSWKITNPQLLTKLALIVDDYKEKQIPALWKEAEEKIKTTMPLLDLTTFFHEELSHDKKAKMIFCYRYYTPLENRTSFAYNEQNEGIN